MSSKKQLTIEWEAYVNNLQEATPLPNESRKEKAARKKKLEADPELWFKFHFPNYAYAEPAKFHKRATKRILKNKKFYSVRAWSRELAKSTRTMMEVLYMSLVKKEVKNMLLVSHSADNATDLLTPYRLNLEFNQRLINDYGVQKSLSKWEAGQFTTKKGVSYRAIGGGQSPRGTKNEYARPDKIVIDDFDTDEICRNPTRIKSRWAWIEKALIPTVSISQDFRITFLGNIIAPDCTIIRAMKKADHSEVVNIRDKNGHSTWPEKNSEENIDYILGKISYASQQQEYYNNPIREGTVFKDMIWGKVPPLSRLRLLVHYGDPAPSNKEAKSGSYKTVVEVAEKDGIFYVIRIRLERTTNSTFITWYHDLDEGITGRVLAYKYMENNSLQNPFFQQVYRPLMEKINKERNASLYITPDERTKPDKFVRIEGNLEPLHRNSKLILNEKEKDNPHMKRLEEQFEAVEPKLAADVDGVDAVEGAIWVLQNKLKVYAPLKIGKHKRSRSKHY